MEKRRESRTSPDKRRDRTARLLKLQIILWQYPQGLTIDEIARHCGVSGRTVYRDLDTLQEEVGVPIWEDGSRRGIAEGYALPPIPFTLPEALNIFLAARLMQSYSWRYNPAIASAFMKLNAVVSSPLREQIQKTIAWLEKHPQSDSYAALLKTITEAWVTQHRLHITYRAFGEDTPIERIVEPYFLEPQAAGRADYLIAFCHRAGEIRTFKLDRIENASISRETYIVPLDFDALDYLKASWGIFVDGQTEVVKLRFYQPVSRIINETVWHPSQKLEEQPDGSLMMTLKITHDPDFVAWVLGWGGNVEVLEPDSLRQDILNAARAMIRRYSPGPDYKDRS